MADGVRADDGTDEEVYEPGAGCHRQGGSHVHRGVMEVEPKPGGAVYRDEPDRPIEQHPHPPMQPRNTLFPHDSHVPFVRVASMRRLALEVIGQQANRQVAVKEGYK